MLTLLPVEATRLLSLTRRLPANELVRVSSRDPATSGPGSRALKQVVTVPEKRMSPPTPSLTR